MAIYDNQQNNLASEYYALSGKNPDKDSKQDLINKKMPMKLIIFLIVLVFLCIWFGLNLVLINTSTK